MHFCRHSCVEQCFLSLGDGASEDAGRTGATDHHSAVYLDAMVGKALLGFALAGLEESQHCNSLKEPQFGHTCSLQRRNLHQCCLWRNKARGGQDPERRLVGPFADFQGLRRAGSGR